MKLADHLKIIIAAELDDSKIDGPGLHFPLIYSGERRP